jgi:hypothetical protein
LSGHHGHPQVMERRESRRDPEKLSKFCPENDTFQTTVHQRWKFLFLKKL